MMRKSSQELRVGDDGSELKTKRSRIERVGPLVIGMWLHLYNSIMSPLIKREPSLTDSAAEENEDENKRTEG